MSAWTCECGTVYDTDHRFDCPKCGRRFDDTEDDEMGKPASLGPPMTEEERQKMNDVAHLNERIVDVANELGTEGRYEDDRIAIKSTDHDLIVWIKYSNGPFLKVWHNNQIRKKGRWCLYLEVLAKKARAARRARQDEADKKQREEEEARFGPVDDAALFPEFVPPANPVPAKPEPLKPQWIREGSSEADPNYRPPPPKPLLVDGFPRRSRTNLWCPAEKAIQAAVDAVEEAGADLLLTDAVNLLIQARDKVADWYESQPTKDA